MDSRDIIILGLVGVGGYFAWRWWTNRPIVDAQQTAPGTAPGNAASSMTDSAARTTVFGGAVTQKLLAPIVSSAALSKKPLPTASAGTVANQQLKAYTPVQRQVVSAVLAPMPNAPSPNNLRYTSTGIVGVNGTQPKGDQPQPGDPSVLQTRAFA